MSFFKPTFYVLIAVSILMAVSSEAMLKVQGWVTHASINYYSSENTVEKRNGLQVYQPPRMVQVGAGRQSVSFQSKQPTKLEVSQKVSQAPEQSIRNNVEPTVEPMVQSVQFSQESKKEINTPLRISVHQPMQVNHSTEIKTDVKDLSSPSSTALPELVLYPDEIVIAFPKKIASTENIQKAVSRVLLSGEPLSESNLLTTQPIDLTQRPYFYRKVLDQHQTPVRYPMQAFKYADYLMDNHVEEYQDDDGRFITLHIPLVEYGISGPAKNYQAWVENYAREFKVPPSLVYAVMETESAFNPNAVSRSNAIGLMQLKADAAGKDVYQMIDAKPGQPSLSELFDSKSNIRMGTAYLGLLKHDYLAEIVDERIKQMVTISSYNGGLNTVLGLFGETPKAAAKQLNRMSPKQVYRKLRFEHQSDETRRYLEKVLKAESKYRDLLRAA